MKAESELVYQMVQALAGKPEELGKLAERAIALLRDFRGQAYGTEWIEWDDKRREFLDGKGSRNES